MSYFTYVDKRFQSDTLKLIRIVDSIANEYVAMGYRLTLRQLYYQLVSRSIIPNSVRAYKNLSKVVNEGKYAGLIDWDAIEDRMRSIVRRNRWESRFHALASTAHHFHMDMWEGQPTRVFVVVEKDALASVLEPICLNHDTPLLAARGYPSGTVLKEWVDGELGPTLARGQNVLILHLGDHDPSGLDMTRDLLERVELFVDSGPEGLGFGGDHEYQLKRIALNIAQIREFNPPPNPVKPKDARSAGYVKEFGISTCWELDALHPKTLEELVTSQIEKVKDKDVWAARAEVVKRARERMEKVAKVEGRKEERNRRRRIVRERAGDME